MTCFLATAPLLPVDCICTDDWQHALCDSLTGEFPRMLCLHLAQGSLAYYAY